METKYLVIMPYCWGTGASIAEAEKMARAEGGPRPSNRELP